MREQSLDPSNYVHLHVHTEYSILDGINRVKTLPNYVKGLGQVACAITDHGNVSGSYAFWKQCKLSGIKPIIGMEAYYTVTDRTAKEKDDLDQAYYHLVLLAKNHTGLINLFKLSSQSYIDGLYYKPRIDDALLSEHAEGLIATSACLGSRSSQLILRGEINQAKKLLEHHAAIFKDNFFIEIQLHQDAEQQLINKVLLEIAKEYDWPILLTNDCHYTEEEDKLIHEMALCIQTNDVMSNEDRFSFNDIQVHVASHDWMWNNAQQQSLPYEAIKNTRYIADSVDADSYFGVIKNRYPKFRNLPDGLTSHEALERLSKNLLIERFNGEIPPKEYRDRLDHELHIIKKMGFSDYMLIDWELVEGARSIGVLVGPGRGSAAGSLVAYALGITQIDPIKHDLVFERFLNYGRAGKPLILNQDIKQALS